MENQKRLIDANELKDWFLHCAVRMDAEVIDERIDKAPTVNAIEPAHGRWRYSRDAYICSVCREKAPSLSIGLSERTILSDYCPHCGAKMDA